MKSPFPGMDPYLESPQLWPNVHQGLIVAVQELLNKVLLPRYACVAEERVYVAPDPYPGLAKVRVPDVHVTPIPSNSAANLAARLTWPREIGYELFEIEETVESLREPYLSIRRMDGGHVVTIIELLSPANKAAGTAAHEEYLKKRQEVLQSQVHLVEIDLLRAGKRPLATFRSGGDLYAVYVNQAPQRWRTEALLWPLAKPLPVIPVPLTEPDPPAGLDLKQALDLAFERGAYYVLIDYTKPPAPPLTAEHTAWAEDLIARGRRGAVPEV